MRNSERAGLTELMLLNMSKLQKVILAATILVVTIDIISKLIDTIQEQREEIGRLDRNVSALVNNEISYMTKLGNAAQQRKALELSQKELKTVNADLAQRDKRFAGTVEGCQISHKGYNQNHYRGKSSGRHDKQCSSG